MSKAFAFTKVDTSMLQTKSYLKPSQHKEKI